MDLWELLMNIIILYIIYKVCDTIYRIPFKRKLHSNGYFFITGCDTGFGHELAIRLDRLGCHIYAGCLTEAGETELKKACSERLNVVHLDVSKHDSVVKAYEEVKAKLPQGQGLNGVLNNAGIAGKFGPVEWLKLDDYKQVNSINLYGLVDVTTTFLPLVKMTKGRIVNTASIVGRFSLEGSAPYNISKYGVEAFSDSLRRQLRVFGVSVHIIEPGFHKTNFLDLQRMISTIKSVWEQAPQESKEEYGEAFLEKSCEVLLPNMVSQLASPNIDGVVDAYEHALTAMFPRARYMVGYDAKYVFWTFQLMPEWLCDWLMEKMAGLQGMKNVPAAVAKQTK